jgi:hypothetical protein
LVVERRDRGLGLGFVGHFDEAEPARAAGLAVRHHLGAGDRAGLLKHRDEVFGRRCPGQVADVDVRCH